MSARMALRFAVFAVCFSSVSAEPSLARITRSRAGLPCTAARSRRHSFSSKSFSQNSANHRRVGGHGYEDSVKGLVSSFMDISAFVSSEGTPQKRSVYRELADAIGKDVYIDINGWHLYWRDISMAPDLKLSDLVATSIGPQLKSISNQEVLQLIERIPINLGSGKLMVPLAAVTPSGAVQRLYDAVEDASKDSW